MRAKRAAAPAWPALSPELVALDDLKPNPRNARVHSKAQQEQLANLLEKYGWTSSVLRDETGEILAGHGRLLGARVLVARGLKDYARAPVITARGWSEAQKRAYVLADNQVALNAGWDAELLNLELKAISGLGFDMDLIGFSPTDLRRALGSSGAGLIDEDEVPELQPKPITRRGDMWLLGNHRLMCGDSTSKQDVSRLIALNNPHLCATDPPYGVDYDPSWRGKAKSGDGKRLSIGVHAQGVVLNDRRNDWLEAWVLFPGDVIYCWHAVRHASSVQTSLEKAGFDVRAQIIWGKNNMVIGRGDYHMKHEPCWYAVRRGRNGHWVGGRKQTTLWDIPKPMKSETGHSTQKPVECMRRPIENNSKPGDHVYEPFMGSGTTLIACEETKRICLGMELNTAYVDVAVRRWQAFTGKVALLSGREISFEEVEGERKNGKARAKAHTDKAAPGDRPNRRRSTGPKVRAGTKSAGRASASA